MYLTVEVSVMNCATANVVAADRNINDKAVEAIKTKVQKFKSHSLLLKVAIFETLLLTHTSTPVLQASCAKIFMT